VTPVQSTIASEAVLGKPEKLAFRLDSPPQSEEFNVVICHV
jgi:hypothetical protein